jgi:hypothetical protein
VTIGCELACWNRCRHDDRANGRQTLRIRAFTGSPRR